LFSLQQSDAIWYGDNQVRRANRRQRRKGGKVLKRDLSGIFRVSRGQQVSVEVSAPSAAARFDLLDPEGGATVSSLSHANRFDFTMDRSRLQLSVSLMQTPGVVNSKINFSSPHQGTIIDSLQLGQLVAFYEFTDDPGPS
jgi:hypothetical protein